MSWAEIKKAVNSDLSTPLNELMSNFTAGSATFTSNGTFTVPDNIHTIYVTLCDGGGGGGGGGAARSNYAGYNGGNGGGSNGGAGSPGYIIYGQYWGNGGGGGGGSAGKYICNYPLNVSPGDTLDIIVGTGGVGGAGGTFNELSGTGTPGDNGTAGGKSKVVLNNITLVSTDLPSVAAAHAGGGGNITTGYNIRTGGGGGGIGSPGNTPTGGGGGTGGASKIISLSDMLEKAFIGGGGGSGTGDNSYSSIQDGHAYGGGGGGGTSGTGGSSTPGPKQGKGGPGGSGSPGIVIILYGKINNDVVSIVKGGML